MKVLIAGGSGGIGQALVSALMANPSTEIHATYRTQKPSLQGPNLQWHRLDLCNEMQLAQLTDSLPRLDLVINCCGLLHQQQQRPEKALSEFSASFFELNINSNALIAINLAKHCQNALKASAASHFVCLSARIGSIGDNRKGGWLSYRASKAALNMAIRTIAIEWQRTLPRCCVFLFHPGTVDTPLSQPFQPRIPSSQLRTAEQCAHGLLELISTLDSNDSGKYLDYRGDEIPW